MIAQTFIKIKYQKQMLRFLKKSILTSKIRDTNNE